MTWPDPISVHHNLYSSPSITSNSIQIGVLVLSDRHQRPAARWVEDLVFNDYADGRKSELKTSIFSALQDAWVEQEKRRTQSEKRIQELMIRLTKLEKESWDREGAQEDMGDA